MRQRAKGRHSLPVHPFTFKQTGTAEDAGVSCACWRIICLVAITAAPSRAGSHANVSDLNTSLWRYNCPQFNKNHPDATVTSEYVGTTPAGCAAICNNLTTSQCSAFHYAREEKLCQLLRSTASVSGVALLPKTGSNYYARAASSKTCTCT